MKPPGTRGRKTKIPDGETNAEGIASAASAWIEGLKGGPGAILWLGRAARLAPNDPRIAIDLARARMGGTMAEIAAAAEAFEVLAQRHDALAIWLGLAATRHRLGEHKAAGKALEHILTRHCMPDAPEFGVLALRIAEAAGYGGIRGQTAAGETLQHGAGRLLGGAPDISALTRVEGLVALDEKFGLRGWASRPAAPEEAPVLFLEDANGSRRAVRFGKILAADDDAPLLIRHGFSYPARQLQGLTPPFSLRGADGRALMGSPVDPVVLNMAPHAAAKRGKKPHRVPKTAPLAVIIPIYRGLAETKACLTALKKALPRGARVIVVDDATPEPALAAWAIQQAAKGAFELRRNRLNQGFAASVNTGLKAARGHDVLLLNSDTLVPRGAIETMIACLYAAPDTGSVTPLSNEATILSFPDPRGGNPAPDLKGTERLNRMARQANELSTVEIPTGIGFCMLLRHDCLKATGGFRPEIFAQGYGEENDWCIRARHLGFSHHAALGAYVAHLGGVSFGEASRGLTARNLALLNRLYPGYHALVMEHIYADPLREARAGIDILQLRADKSPSVLLISHSHGGGVGRQVAVRTQKIRALGLRPLLLNTQFPEDPEHTPYPWPAQLSASTESGYANLIFELPARQGELLSLLKTLGVRHVELHHTLGHHPGVRELASLLGVSQDIVIHDYGSFCPRVNLLTPGDADLPRRYCGEPSIAGCIECCARAPEDIYEALPPPQLRARSAAEFAQASRVIAPSNDAARRIARHFPGVKPVVTPWENDAEPLSLRPPSRGPRKIIVIGGIGRSKGFELLADCARDARARGLGLEFTVAGGSADDAALLEAGIFVTGHYAEREVQALIASQKPDLAFLPSIWPETWCFTLSEAWRAGLYAVAFDLGAPAERIKTTKRGLTLPLGLPVPRINDILLKWMP